jgi:hypothetical protein
MPKRAPPLKATYGLCDAPQNADDFASSPVSVTAGKCDNTQQFSSTSVQPSTGGACGGYTVAFGPLGDLKPFLDRGNLIADWGDAPLTGAQCAKARVAAIGWGARCINAACTEAEWQKLGDAKQRAGTWNPNSKVCYICTNFYSSDTKFRTLNLDIIATLDQNGTLVRKRAKGTIIASHPNGKCYSTTQPASSNEATGPVRSGCARVALHLAGRPHVTDPHHR